MIPVFFATQVPILQRIFKLNMGRKNKNNKNNNNRKKQKTNDWNKKSSRDEYISEFSNAVFQLYYKKQLLQPYFSQDPAEFDTFWTSLSQPLPITFRINPTQHNYQLIVKNLLSGQFVKKLVQDPPPNLIQPVPWYPDNLVYESKLAKKELRKSEQLHQLHSYIQKCNNTGLFTRQELVSMLPPLFLKPKKGELVLDMCAAPGSKTCQMLEMMQGGCIIANDVDQRRAFMLSHQLQRLPSAPIIVTTHAAQFFPGKKVFFDKVLCDVPCTGDGAARKLPTRWARWSTKDGNVIHPLQLSILMRALSVCKVGGLVMYSTCSLNPIEDEAVVADVFRRVRGRPFELVDLHTIPNFKGREGLKDWKVYLQDDMLIKFKMEYEASKKEQAEKKEEKEEKKEEKNSNEDEFFESIKDEDYLYEVKNLEEGMEVKKVYGKYSFKQDKSLKGAYKQLRPSLFPMKNMEKIGIEKTMRIMPHDQDTGGFYLAMFRKLAPIIWHKPDYTESEDDKMEQQEEQKEEQNEDHYPKLDEDEIKQVLGEQEEEEEKEEEKEEGTRQWDDEGRKKFKQQQGESFSQINPQDWRIIKEYYAIDDEFPSEQIYGVTMNSDPLQLQCRKFRFVSKECREILEGESSKLLKVVNIGCRLFERGKESFGGQVSPFKICQEGIHYVARHMGKRKIQCTLDELLFFCRTKSVRVENLENKELAKQINDVLQGCFVLEGGDEYLACQLFKGMVNLMCTSEQSDNILIRHDII